MSDLNMRELARLTGADRAAIRRWIGNETDQEKALAIVRERIGAPATTEPKEKLTWFQKKERETARRLARENAEAEAVQAKRWVPVETVFEILRATVGRLEQLPGRSKSEAGLTDSQAAVILKLVDDMRTQIAADIEGMKPIDVPVKPHNYASEE